MHLRNPRSRDAGPHPLVEFHEAKHQSAGTLAPDLDRDVLGQAIEVLPPVREYAGQVVDPIAETAELPRQGRGSADRRGRRCFLRAYGLVSQVHRPPVASEAQARAGIPLRAAVCLALDLTNNHWRESC